MGTTKVTSGWCAHTSVRLKSVHRRARSLSSSALECQVHVCLPLEKTVPLNKGRRQAFFAGGRGDCDFAGLGQCEGNSCIWLVNTLSRQCPLIKLENAIQKTVVIGHFIWQHYQTHMLPENLCLCLKLLHSSVCA